MARPTFTWYPDHSAQEDVKPNVQITKFGDGYESRVARGLNTCPQVWTLTFDRNLVEANEIRTFLQGLQGTATFSWTNPFSETGVYVCDSWKTSRKPGGLIVSVTFRQVFEY